MQVVGRLQELYVRPPAEQVLHVARGPPRCDVKPPLEVCDAKRWPLTATADWLRLHRVRLQLVAQVHGTIPKLAPFFEASEQLNVQVLEPLPEREHRVELAERQYRARHRLERPVHLQPVLQVELELPRQRPR